LKQKTFVMIKPDAVRRGLIGEVISTLERAQLTINRLEMRRPTEDVVGQHYPDTEDWLRTAGGKTLAGYEEAGVDVVAELGTNDTLEIGRMIKRWLVEFLCSGEVVIMIVEGNLAVTNVRRLCGHTLPIFADPGSIRGRFSSDSPDQGNAEHRPVLNLIHASGTEEEARFEIALWFGS